MPQDHDLGFPAAGPRLEVVAQHGGRIGDRLQSCSDHVLIRLLTVSIGWSFSEATPQPESAGSRSSREMERALRSERPPPSFACDRACG